jgi:hypothetical protein
VYHMHHRDFLPTGIGGQQRRREHRVADARHQAGQRFTTIVSIGP